MAHTVMLDLAGDDWLTGEIADYFDPAWRTDVRLRAATKVEPWVDDPNVIGFFLDNEIRWGADWRGSDTLLQLYLALPDTAPGKEAAVDSLLDELGSIDGVNERLGTTFASRKQFLEHTEEISALDPGEASDLTNQFLSMAADKYFAVTVGAVRDLDANHLVLGNREVAVLTPRPVYEAAASRVDVVSVNNYVFIEGLAELTLQISGRHRPRRGSRGRARRRGHADPNHRVRISRRRTAACPTPGRRSTPFTRARAIAADAFEAYAPGDASCPLDRRLPLVRVG